MNEVTILLGAGFSAPIGYPTGKELNEMILDCKGDNFAFHTSGVLVVNDDGTKPNFGYKTSYDNEFDFCMTMVKYFKESRGYFDYEEFYDFLKESAITDPEVIKLSRKYASNGGFAQLLYRLDNIIQQVVLHFIKDRNGKKYYDDEPYCAASYFPGYTGIMRCLKTLSEKNYVNVHTLNHDLFFESFNNTDFIAGELCDGFEELGSEFYGHLNLKGRVYTVRLAKYSGRYDKRFRLYKHHGSRGYCIHYEPPAGQSLHIPKTYVKTRYGIGVSEIYREIENPKTGRLEYFLNQSNYHSDFLTGTTSKIQRYKEPLLYKNLFEHFKENLRKANLLLIIGYGCRDSEINQLVANNFPSSEKHSCIIDPFPGDAVIQLQKKLGSKLITKQLDDITMEDILK